MSNNTTYLKIDENNHKVELIERGTSLKEIEGRFEAVSSRKVNGVWFDPKGSFLVEKTDHFGNPLVGTDSDNNFGWRYFHTEWYGIRRI